MSEEEEHLKSYILGRLPEPEQIKVEERLLLDSDYVERLQIVEEELIDGYARGWLPEDERKQLEESVASSPVLQRKLTMARPFITRADKWRPARKDPSGSAWQRWFGPLRSLMAGTTLAPAWRVAVWAAILLAGGVVCWRLFFYQSLADKARIALRASFRESPIDGRIAGLNWPPRRATLGGGSGAADDISLDRAKSLSHQAVADKGTPDSHHALGQVYLANGEFDKAILELEKALESDPKNAGILSDLGTAYLERARSAQVKARDKTVPEAAPSLQDFVQDFNQCLKHLNQAKKLDGSLLPALFNIALCHEYMALLPQAQTDWEEYLKHDSNSAWAAEARKHLEQIQERQQKNSESNTELLDQFHTAYASSDRQAAWKLVSGNREVITGRIIWWQLLSGFFGLLAAGDVVQANNRLRELEYVGNLELSLGNEDGRQAGDPYVLNLARFYTSATSEQLRSLAEAHKHIDEGNGFFAPLHGAPAYPEAIRRYRMARDAYDRSGNGWEALLADYLIGNCLFRMGDTENSLLLFSQLVADCRSSGYLSLLAQSLFSLGMVQDSLAERSRALENTEESFRVSEKIGDVYSIQRSLAQIADQYRKLGNYESASFYIHRCLEHMSAEWPGTRQMWRNCRQLTQLLAARRLNDAAADYADAALRFALEINDSSFTSVSYEDLSLLRWKQRFYDEAFELAQRGLLAASDRDRKVYASLQLAYLHRQSGDLHQALGEYERSIEYLKSAEEGDRSGAGNQHALTKTDTLPALLYEAHKGKLFCLLAAGDDRAVEQELQTTLGLLEQFRQNILDEPNRDTFFDAEQTVYDAAIDFAYSRRNDHQAVFEFSEQSRARSLLDLIDGLQGTDGSRDRSRTQGARGLSEARQALPDRTQLVEYAALQDKLLICLLSRSGLRVVHTAITLDELTDRVLRFRGSILTQPGLATAAEQGARIRQQAQDLYRVLIEPINLSPEDGPNICLVPDKILNNLPFSALVSPGTGRYLVEDYQVTVAPSATVYLVCSGKNNHTGMDSEHLFAVGNPEFDRSAFPELSPLQSTEGQVRDIARLYSSGSPLVLTGAQAQKARIKEEMVRADVIHLSAHYQVYPGRPMNSRLLLAQTGDADSAAGFLRANEMYELKLSRAPVVVLSACDSGVEYYYNGEGMIGMSRVFIAAGAPVVVASLWQVETGATGKLMVSFHQHRKVDGNPTAQALAAAQRGMLSGALGEDYRHPYYWAGFAAIGGATTF